MSMFVITHKDFDYPLSKGYTPLLVGAKKNSSTKNYLKDNKGDNISSKNESYCELTGLYWIWKNINNNHVGISHYRRYFSKFTSYNMMIFMMFLKGKLTPVTLTDLDNYLKEYDWILPYPSKLVENSVGEQFISSHNKADLEATRTAIKKLYPDYIMDFDNVMNQKTASFFNMFYTRKEELDDYCKWLFDILTEVEKNIDITNYDNYQKRIFGFLGERLLNVWICHHNLNIKYLSVFNTQTNNRLCSLKEFKHTILGWN